MENEQIEKRVNFKYKGSYFWLVFWLLIFFPVSLTLVFLNTSFFVDNTSYRFNYEANRFWPLFWAFIFFPVTILLFILNGAFLITSHDSAKIQ
ncbi:MAG TPA: hypothetical protein PLC42_00325 [Parachlamydiaceae bacterium]|nr:hypothetical protein [Parachlamydiaceae bacterium]